MQYTYADFASSLPQSDERFADAHRARLHVEELARRRGHGVLVLPMNVAGGLDWRSCHEKGLPVHAQRGTVGIRNSPFPLNLADGGISAFDTCKEWRSATVGTTEEITAKLRDPSIRERLRSHFSALPLSSWTLTSGATLPTAVFNGMRLFEIAKPCGGKSLIDTFLDLQVMDDLRSDWDIYFSSSFDLRDYQSIAGDHWWVPGISDGGAHVRNTCLGHYGTLFLSTYVREHRWMSLEEAHYRLSALPAHVAGLQHGMGTITVGAPADIVVYSLDDLEITAPAKLYDYPGGEWRLADRGVGYHWVLVNGEVTIENDKETQVNSGRIVESFRSPNTSDRTEVGQAVIN